MRSEQQVIGAEMRLYYLLRKLTFKLDVTDREYSRPSIPRGVPLSRISREYLERCFEEELDALEKYGKFVDFAREAHAREVRELRARIKSLEDDVGRYRKIFGVPDEKNFKEDKQ